MIRLINIGKTYRTGRVKKVVFDGLSVDFDPRYSYGIMGLNGAGKSTLMRIIAGTELPDRGRVERGASVSWPLAFNGGFHPYMTGRQNLKFVSNIYGVDSAYVLDYVTEFAELGPYLDAPVGTYSSGMQSRLGFGLSMAIEFDFYLMDETISVGDERFAERCARALRERRARSGFMLAAHSTGNIKKYCDRGIILQNGRVTLFDSIDEAIKVYKESIK